MQLVQLAGENNTAERAMNLVPDVVDKISGLFSKNTSEPHHKPEPTAAPQE